MRNYKFFRLCLAVLVVVLLALAALDFYDKVPEKPADIGFAIIAALLAVVAAFAIRPPGDEVTEAFTGAMATMPEDVLVKLRERTIQAEELKAYIEVASNQVFLQKMEYVLSTAIVARYSGSEIERLVQELDKVENELRRANLPVLSKDIPDRLRRTIAAIKTDKDKSSATDDLLRELGYPAPLRKAISFMTDVVMGMVGFR